MGRASHASRARSQDQTLGWSHRQTQDLEQSTGILQILEWCTLEFFRYFFDFCRFLGSMCKALFHKHVRCYPMGYKWQVWKGHVWQVWKYQKKSSTNSRRKKPNNKEGVGGKASSWEEAIYIYIEKWQTHKEGIRFWIGIPYNLWEIFVSVSVWSMFIYITFDLDRTQLRISCGQFCKVLISIFCKGSVKKQE